MTTPASSSGSPVPGAPGLRRAVPDDVPALVALVQRAYRGEPSRVGWTTEADLLDGQRTDADAVAALLAAPGSHVLLLEDDGRLLGCCHVEARRRPDGGTTGYVGMVAVDPARQGSGTGRRLLGAAEAYARAVLGADDLEMTVVAQRHELVAWYERRGWARTGERRPFPYGDERFGVPRRDDLEFVVLARAPRRAGPAAGGVSPRKGGSTS